MASRRALFFSVAALAALGGSAARAQAAGMRVVYVGADDCPPCKTWEAQDMPAYINSAASLSVPLIRIKSQKSANAFQQRNWPSNTQGCLRR